MKLTRRRFLQNAGITAAAVATWKIPKGVMATSPVPAGTVATTGGLPGSLGAKEVPSVCEMCFWRCPIVGKVKDGKIVKIEGNPKSPTNGHRVCARGNSGIQLIYDPDRLKYPMKRVGARGEGKWARISWNEALDEITHNIKKVRDKYGPSSLAMFDHGASAEFYREIFKGLGTENYSNEPAFFQCMGAVSLAYLVTYGYKIAERVDMANAKAMVFFGTHLGENIHLSHVREYIAGLQNRAKLVVVDPRFSAPAGKADLWLPIRPGTDTALLLAWINYVIQNGLYDKDFVQRNCEGFDELKEAVKGYSLGWAARICDLKLDDIRRGIEMLAASRPHVTVHPGRHSAWYGRGDVQRHRAMAILTALFGAVGVPGGLYFPTPFNLEESDCLECEEPEDVEEPETSIKEKYPFTGYFGSPTAEIIKATRTGEPYPVKLWGICGVNILQTIPNPYETMEAIKKLDFIFSIEILPTESAIWSDIILPEANYLERYDRVYANHDLTPYVTVRQPVMKPMFEAKPPFWIAKELAKRLDLDCFTCEREEEYLDEQLEAMGLSLAKLNKEGGLVTLKGNPYRDPGKAIKVDTESGKIELFSSAFDDEDMDPIPKFEPTPAPPKGYARLVYGRVPMHTFSRTMNNLWLSNECPEGKLWLNDEVAKKMGVKDGDEVIIENQDAYRSNPVKLMVTPGIRHDIVYLPHGFGSRSPLLTKTYKHGASDQFLITRYEQDPFFGGSSHRTDFVRLIKDGKTLDVPELRPIPSEIPRFEIKMAS